MQKEKNLLQEITEVNKHFYEIVPLYENDKLLQRYADFFRWLSEQRGLLKKKHLEEGGDRQTWRTTKECAVTSMVENQLFCSLMQTDATTGHTLRFKETAEHWDGRLVKKVLTFINVTKGSLERAGKHSLKEFTPTEYEDFCCKGLLPILQDIWDCNDFNTIAFCFIKLHREEFINLVELAKSRKAAPTQPKEHTRLGEQELFNEGEEELVFWNSEEKRNLTLQEFIDNGHDLNFLKWPDGGKRQWYTRCIKGVYSEEEEHKEFEPCGSITWQHTYKGKPLWQWFKESEHYRNVQGKIVTKAMLDEIDNMLNLSAENLLNGDGATSAAEWEPTTELPSIE